MAEMTDVEKEFVERTLQIIDSTCIEHDVSFLLNCTFGLVIFPMAATEIASSKNSWRNLTPWNKELNAIDTVPSFIGDRLADPGFPTTVGDLMHRVRNALCHQKPNIYNEEGTISEVELNLGQQGLAIRVRMRKGEFKELTVFLAKHYLASVVTSKQSN